MTKKLAEKYLHAIEGCKTRHLTCEALSHYVGIYPEIIANDLSFFDPLLAMDPSFELRDLLGTLKQYVEKHSKSETPKKAEPVPEFKLEAKQYKSVADFVYKKMTINGLVDRGASLKEDDLKILKILVQNELDRR